MGKKNRYSLCVARDEVKENDLIDYVPFDGSSHLTVYRHKRDLTPEEREGVGLPPNGKGKGKVEKTYPDEPETVLAQVYLEKEPIEPGAGLAYLIGRTIYGGGWHFYTNRDGAPQTAFTWDELCKKFEVYSVREFEER